jgi:hypothetical protein
MEYEHIGLSVPEIQLPRKWIDLTKWAGGGLRPSTRPNPSIGRR